jgi:hypothetical protein
VIAAKGQNKREKSKTLKWLEKEEEEEQSRVINVAAAS